MLLLKTRVPLIKVVETVKLFQVAAWDATAVSTKDGWLVKVPEVVVRSWESSFWLLGQGAVAPGQRYRFMCGFPCLRTRRL